MADDIDAASALGIFALRAGIDDVGIDEAAQRQRQRSGLTRARQRLRLFRLQFERHRLAEHRCFTIFFLRRLIDGEHAHIRQDNLCVDDVWRAAAFLALPIIEGKARGPLTGIWKSRYEYPSSSRGKTFASEHTVIVLQHGARVQVRSIAGQGQVSMDLSVDGTTVTGTWNEITSADGYYRGARYSGAIQLLVEPSGHRMAGQWVGYGRSFDVNTGPWQLDLVTADVSRESVRRHGE